ncbi:MAG TPA: hydroxyacylglutathione hydrolase [Kofleriaceae bacterium]|nr:hydroxyacylglutathione hydrolase [Kofleriaceae bacterium]
MKIVPIPCLADNYAYLVICPDTGQAAVVDPSEAAPVRDAVAREGVQLRAIWNTHHHWDHVGGNQELLAAHPDLEVVAHVSDQGRVPGQTRGVDQADEIALGSLTAAIVHNPGHTRGAISYVVRGAGGPAAVFTGDTLFGAGCGRLFEGTPTDMHASLGKLAALPPDTRVYCGHEYTASNLAFAAAAEPKNAEVAARRAAVDELRGRGEPTVPFTMADELATNPFVRAGSAERLGELRAWKDRF